MDSETSTERSPRMKDPASTLFAGPGPVRAACREIDWTRTPLGAVDRWPASLQTAVRLCLDSPTAMCVWAGPELVLIFNEGYSRTLGPDRHPWALGRPGREVWNAFWDWLGPVLEGVIQRGKPFYHEDHRVVIHRGGKAAEACFTYSHTPIREPDGRIVGSLNVVQETTERVGLEDALRQSEERQAFLLELSDALRPLGDPAEIQNVAMRVLGRRLGIARAHYYEADPSGQYVESLGGHADGTPPAVGRFRLDDFGTHLAKTYRVGRTMVVHDIGADHRLNEAERRAYEPFTTRAFVGVPLVKNGQLVVVLVVDHDRPREWSSEDVALIEEVADRTWAAVERARAEAALRESEQRFRALTAATSDVIYQMSPDWTVMRQLEGRQFIPDTRKPRQSWLQTYIPKPAQPRVTQSIDQAIETCSVFELEHRVVRVDGTVGWTHSRAIPIVDDGGEITAWFGAASDITDRKQAEQDLAKAKEYAERIVETLHEPLLVLHADLTVKSANPAFFEHFAVAPLETIGCKIYDLGNGQWNISALRKLLEDVPDSNAFHDFEVRHDFESIGERIMLLNARKLDDAQILLGIRDITAHQTAVEKLRQSEEKYRSLFESIDEGFCIIEVLFDERDEPVDYLFLEVNPAFERHTGLVDAADKRMRQLAPGHEEHWFETYGRIVLTGEPRRFESRAAELQRWYDVYAWRHGPPRGRQVAILFADITERKETELALAEANERLLESDRRKDEFLAMLGHELRNPLAAIRNAAEVVKSVAPGDGLLQRAQGVLERQSVHMTRLIDGLLEVSRIARGKIRLERETLDLRDVVNTVLQDRHPEAAARGLALLQDPPPEPVWIYADQVRMVQVIDNLVGNSIKFTNAGDSIRVLLRIDGDRADLRIRDSGVGIRPEMIESLFEPFQQESQEIARSAGGLGLGLALAKGLVELHDGTIEAHSEGLGLGAEFRVRLPLTTSPARGDRMETAEVTSHRILVVEDNTDTGQSLRDLLEMLGHRVEVVETGSDALRALSQRGADVVLCDLGLPGMSGFDVARAIRSHPSLGETPVVALTGYGQPEDRRKTKEAGFDAHLVKPVDIDALNETLRSLCAIDIDIDSVG
ncbi:ATP-binding protein [Paraliomyxa miuraensis]|uniref:ATP-binding protein n=1 Tax=Paraliomyxa miuraensis TaxID=376150 RepID=UPI0022587E88|nr:ATP-binding protein [Paraliomyxa miuraensis]MCX4241881.1 ATP-binding protein [Paraliomyxa miuraensis]